MYVMGLNIPAINSSNSHPAVLSRFSYEPLLSLVGPDLIWRGFVRGPSSCTSIEYMGNAVQKNLRP